MVALDPDVKEVNRSDPGECRGKPGFVIAERSVKADNQFSGRKMPGVRGNDRDRSTLWAASTDSIESIKRLAKCYLTRRVDRRPFVPCPPLSFILSLRLPC